MGVTSAQPKQLTLPPLEGSRLLRVGRMFPFPLYRYQATVLADRSPLRIVNKARQTGVSTIMMGEAVDAAFTEPGTLSLFVSRNMDTAIHLMSYGYRVLRRLGLMGEMSKANEMEIALTNGSRLKSLASSRDTGRGFDANRVYVDEQAHQLYGDEIYESVGPTIARGGTFTILSTPKGRRNLFYRIWAGLEGGTWSRHMIDWRKCPIYDAAWYERERPKYTAQQWAQEFDCDFIESGMTRFRVGDIEAAHNGAVGLHEPREGRRYLNAWDIGRHHDATVGITLDVTEEPYQVAAFQRHLGLPYPRIQNLIDAHGEWYKGDTVIDSTGAGDPVLENLTCRADGFVFSHKSKQQALDALSLLLEQKRLKFPYIRELEEELLGYEDNDQGIVQDCVMALAMAAYKTAGVGLWAL